MDPRPLHRWKSFWFGILILVFLGWGWVRSMGKGDYLSIDGKLEELVRLDQSGGYIALVWESEVPIYSLPEEPVAWMFGREDARWFPTAFHNRSPVDGWRSVALAHWCLILLFLLVWGGWLGWRWRRKRKAEPGAQAATALPPI